MEIKGLPMVAKCDDKEIPLRIHKLDFLWKNIMVSIDNKEELIALPEVNEHIRPDNVFFAKELDVYSPEKEILEKKQNEVEKKKGKKGKNPPKKIKKELINRLKKGHFSLFTIEDFYVNWINALNMQVKYNMHEKSEKEIHYSQPKEKRKKSKTSSSDQNKKQKTLFETWTNFSNDKINKAIEREYQQMKRASLKEEKEE